MIIGHQKQRNFLEQMVVSGRLPHALLFSGQEKLGKRTVALNLISRLFKETADRLLGGRHPDFILVEPIQQEFGQGARQIHINQIRELSWKLSLKPIRAQQIAAIIDQAHLMTPEAQNCFLKTLEEPKGNGLLILITEYPHFLLPTILSRCEIIKFYPVKKKEISDFLEKRGTPKEKIGKICQISLGKPGLAIDFLENPKKLEEREIKEKELIRILNSNLVRRFEYIKELIQQENLKEILEIWLNYFRSVLLLKLKENYKFDLSIPQLENILQQIQKTIFLISTTNINQRLALEILMLEL